MLLRRRALLVLAAPASLPGGAGAGAPPTPTLTGPPIQSRRLQIFAHRRRLLRALDADLAAPWQRQGSRPATLKVTGHGVPIGFEPVAR